MAKPIKCAMCTCLLEKSIPCKGEDVTYCSQECSDKLWNAYHKYECLTTFYGFNKTSQLVVYNDFVHVNTQVSVPKKFIHIMENSKKSNASDKDYYVYVYIPLEAAHCTVMSNDVEIVQSKLRNPIDTIHMGDQTYQGVIKSVDQDKIVFCNSVTSELFQKGYNQDTTIQMIQSPKNVIISNHTIKQLIIHVRPMVKNTLPDVVSISINYRLPASKWTFKHELFVNITNDANKPGQILTHIELEPIFLGINDDVMLHVDKLSFVNRPLLVTSSANTKYETRTARPAMDEDQTEEKSFVSHSANELDEWIIDNPSKESFFNFNIHNRFTLGRHSIPTQVSLIYLNIQEDNKKRCHPQIMIDFTLPEILTGIEAGKLDVYNNVTNMILSAGNTINSQTRRLFIGAYSAIESTWQRVSDHANNVQDWEITLTNKSTSSILITIAYDYVKKWQLYTLKDPKDPNNGINLKPEIPGQYDEISHQTIYRQIILITPGLSKIYVRLQTM